MNYLEDCCRSEILSEYRIHDNLEHNLYVASVCCSGEMWVDDFAGKVVLLLEELLDVASSIVNIFVLT